MNNLQIAVSLTVQERLDMQMKGMSPFNPEDVKRFKSKQNLNQEEKIKRAKVLFEGATNLGASNEKDIDVTSMIGNVLDSSEISQLESAKVDYRAQAKEDMNSYGSNTEKTFTTDDLMSFKKPLKESVANIKGNPETAKLEGFNLAKSYLNSFVINLQKPSYQSRLVLYKHLQACLKGEEKYKQAVNFLHAYRQGVEQAELAMYKNLQS